MVGAITAFPLKWFLRLLFYQPRFWQKATDLLLDKLVLWILPWGRWGRAQVSGFWAEGHAGCAVAGAGQCLQWTVRRRWRCRWCTASHWPCPGSSGWTPLCSAAPPGPVSPPGTWTGGQLWHCLRSWCTCDSGHKDHQWWQSSSCGKSRLQCPKSIKRQLWKGLQRRFPAEALNRFTHITERCLISKPRKDLRKHHKTTLCCEPKLANCAWTGLWTKKCQEKLPACKSCWHKVALETVDLYKVCLFLRNLRVSRKELIQHHHPTSELQS